ncbi:MAG: hypothetical protein GY797_15855, partial [Deltaproteobacteria bacterium]|nr:hypothetical protein [Deltaproteobacteria bacterium]
VEAGVSSFVAKPFNNDELKQKIEEALGVQPEAEDDREKQPQPKITSSSNFSPYYLRESKAYIQ